MKTSIPVHGVARLGGSIPYVNKSKGIASIIDNGVGSYQFVLSHPVDENYTLIATPKETRDEEPVFVCERNHYERSEIDFLVELKDKEGEFVDADLNFMLIEDSNG